MKLLPLLILLLALLIPAALPAQPVRMASEAFDSRVEIEVRDLPSDRAERAILAAIDEIHRIEQLSRTDLTVAGGVGELNAAAGQGPQRVDPRVREMLERGWNFCVWSRGAHGPLAGRLYQLWGLHQAHLARRPGTEEVFQATGSASCDRLQVNAKEGTANLAAGSQVELWGFARGYAVDRATDILRDHGATNLWVEVGRVRRAVGDGPDGHGRLPCRCCRGSTSPWTSSTCVTRAWWC